MHTSHLLRQSRILCRLHCKVAKGHNQVGIVSRHRFSDAAKSNKLIAPSGARFRKFTPHYGWLSPTSHPPSSPASPIQSPLPYLSDTPRPVLAPGNGNKSKSPPHTTQIPPTLRANALPTLQSVRRTGITQLRSP